MIKTANLTSKALDWALNHALMLERGFVPEIAGALGEPSEMYNHTDPAVCLWLIKAYHLPVFVYQEINGDGCLWQVNFSDDEVNAESWHSLEQAIARCVVAMHLGDEVEVPSELVGERS